MTTIPMSMATNARAHTVSTSVNPAGPWGPVGSGDGDALIEALGKYGVAVHRGGMTSAAKDEARKSFIHGLPRIFLGQLDTREGVDGLQSACSNAVFVEPAWTSGRNEQCVARLYRHLQHDNVLAHFLLVQGSFNEKVLNTVLDKTHNLYETLDRRLV